MDSTRPPLAGRVAIAAQGSEMSNARGVPDTSGAVIWLMSPSAEAPWGHRIVAVVCFTGRSGTKAHRTSPATPKTTAANRAIR
ncbi:putative arabinosyltransferase A domain protein [Mycobacterium ulcerans str. Harvey]|uniref:Arabinosyltransferase A domain protein n=1 Tax=Mycobacterium ulcerans str. Harvey TaxID=1299332 RepID=A0ABP3A411_MYCUL|nr:putative arabinosyltransferase A domain protein [Mycobacterium ulcerans str. Harvey]